ncbi:MAG: aminoglycoside phosphotransferase family protein [Verrucomicrobiales bacterium]|nr:aminoglycoside phosphotransferase family protein [Verrucomicrobiales bacterium]
MWQHADEDLIRRETCLPGFRTLLDETAFLSAMQRLNPGMELSAARLRYLRYKPGTNCLASYEIDAQGSTWWVHGKTWRPGEMELAAVKSLGHGFESTGPLTGGSLPEVACLVRVFPSDAKLRSMGLWMDPAARRRFLAGRESVQALAETTGWQTLNYKAERRLVGRLNWSDGRPAAVVKMHADSGFEAAYQAAKAVAPGARYEVSRYAGKSRRHATLFYHWQEGVGLEPMLERGEGSPRILEAVGAGLAELHRLPPAAGLRVLSSELMAAELVEHAAMMGWLVPGLKSMVDALVEDLSAALGALGGNEAVVHGDFYAKQVLWRSGTVVFLDLDEARKGPAWVDVANFLAHLEAATLAGRITTTSARVAAEVLVASYEAAAGASLPAALSAGVAARLFVQACHCFRRREPNWLEALTRVLDRVRALAAAPPAARRVGGARDSMGSGVGGIANAGVTADPALPFLGQALDVDWMDQRLRRMGEAATAELQDRRLIDATLVRHKPGRRCVIQYRFGEHGAGADLTWLGKARSRRGGSWATRVASGLREAGLNEDGWVAVPEPLGEVPEIHMELQRRVDGQTVFARFEAVPWVREVDDLARRCATAIHRLHVSGVTVGRAHTIADELRVLRGRLERMRSTHGLWADRLDALMAGCERLASSLGEAEVSLIHRDYYPDQVLVDGDRLWLLDLDLCAMGDACLDHGNFLAHLVEWSFRRFGRRDCALSGEAAYREAAIEWLGASAESRLEVYTTLSLARLVQIGTQFPDRQPWVQALLELCEERLKSGTEGRG